MIKSSQEICKFYRAGKCNHGTSGKTSDKTGKICAYSHPQTCKKFELYGNKEKGCKMKKCNNLHLSLCKVFMKHQTCKFGNKCRYFHPHKLKSNNQKQENKNNSGQTTIDTEKLSYAQVVRKPFSQQVQSNQQGPFLGQHFVEQPFLGQRIQTQQAFLDLQNGQKQMMELFMNMNQKMMSNFEKLNFQM